MNHSTSPGGGPAHGPVARKTAVPVLNIANVLTMARLVLVPVFVWLMLQPGDAMRLAAALVFMVAAATDHLDGHLARSWDLITSFGKIVDPIADKALTLSAFVLLSVAGRLWWWVTAVIIVRELGITILRFFMLRKVVMAASRGGKLKTLLQIAGLIGLLVPWTMMLPAGPAAAVDLIGYVIVAAAVIVTVVTGLDYVRQAVILSRTAATE